MSVLKLCSGPRLGTQGCAISRVVTNMPGAAYRYRGTFDRGRVVFISPGIEELVGYTPAEIQELPVENLLFPWLSPHSDHGPNYVDDVRSRYAFGKSMQATHRATTKNGQTRWIMLSSRPVEEHPCNEFTIEGVAVDVTRQVEREQRLVEALAKFAGGVAHDRNNYLGAARVFADLIFEETAIETPPNRYALRIVDACKRATHVVDRVRKFAPGEGRSGVAQSGTGDKRDLAGRERVLLVDDEVALADGLATALTKLGYEVAPVYSPIDALEFVREQPDAWDILVTDQKMPEMDGLDFIKAVRVLRPEIKAILYSGFSEHSRDYILGPGGADAFFHKPVSPAEIAGGIRRIIDGDE